MATIISKLYQIIKNTENYIELEEQIRIYMGELVTNLVGSVFTQLNQAIKSKKQKEGWKVQREDWRTIQCTFGAVRFQQTLMKDKFGTSHYPFNQWIGLRKGQRYETVLTEAKFGCVIGMHKDRDCDSTIQLFNQNVLSSQTGQTIVLDMWEPL